MTPTPVPWPVVYRDGAVVQPEDLDRFSPLPATGVGFPVLTLIIIGLFLLVTGIVMTWRAGASR